MTLDESALNKQISLLSPKGLYLLWGNDPRLLLTWRQRILTLLTSDNGDAETLDGRHLDMARLCESVELFPMMGGRRILSVEDLDPESLSDIDCKALVTLMADLPPYAALLLTMQPDAVDPKKGVRAKKLLAAAEKYGVSARLDHRTAANLKSAVRARCHQKNCALSTPTASLLLERCGDDLGTLFSECDKLCAYANGREITSGMVTRVCPASPEGDVYALARLLLHGETEPLLREVDTLLRLRQSPALLLASLGGAFCDFYRAASARASGHDADGMARDFCYRFEWRVKNAFRDAARLDVKRLFEVCRLLCDAETSFKSGMAADERVLLETTM
ncbi:MAG: DNA polymerase III subunit delta, partial [Oscillospiraceae bacterium]